MAALKKWALTGLSIAHSKSPQLFAAAYPKLTDHSYELLPAASAEEAIQLFHTRGLCGMNVTAPFKSDILRHVDEQSPEVQATGATNTIVLRRGKLVAYNTDIAGVSESLAPHARALKGQQAVVLGAGGAARAALYALQQAGAITCCANRTGHKAVELSAQLGVHSFPLPLLPEQTRACRIIVNTLPATAALLSSLPIQKHHILLDADYAGAPLREAAAAAGAVYISGWYWLLHQAIPAFQLFTGTSPDLAAMRQVLPVF